MLLFLFVIALVFVNAEFDRFSRTPNENELDSDFWFSEAQKTLKNNLERKLNTNLAKNVIFFLGDGMSIATVTAARIYDGQLKGLTGEENVLSFENFPYVALAKTYNVDKQVPDSAGTSTAFFGGVKANYHTLGVTGRVKRNDCKSSLEVRNQVQSIAQWAKKAGKSIGFVTTMRVTHATPAGLYAHSANRDWESDSIMPEDKRECPDIAKQLVYGEPGKYFQVILGGGRKHFLSMSQNGTRLNDTDLIGKWKEIKSNAGANGIYVQSAKELEQIDIENTDYLLGLFNEDHLTYELDKNKTENKIDEPNIIDMTTQAIKMLSKNKNGYYLMVEGGKIDWAHHAGNAKRSLVETIYFHKAIQKAIEMTNSEETLIVVTADHSHTMTINGYPNRGNDILGIVVMDPKETFPYLGYTTLMYTNGPGFRLLNNTEKLSINVSGEATASDDYHQIAAIPRKFETHGGDDVAVYAQGPMSHLFTGVIEQNYIPHAIAHAACLRDTSSKCLPSRDNGSGTSRSFVFVSWTSYTFINFMIIFFTLKCI